MYKEACQNLMHKASESQVLKIAMTGSASSVIGLHPNTLEDYIYTEPYSLAEISEMTRPNENPKFISERACCKIIRELDDKKDPSKALNLSVFLPYFISGPPLSRHNVESNTSCILMKSILN